jgi:hypothetical protein
MKEDRVNRNSRENRQKELKFRRCRISSNKKDYKLSSGDDNIDTDSISEIMILLKEKNKMLQAFHSPK